ncbi:MULTISPECIES: MarR family winged helix-turn-helix transcriptional regulator [unclassified Nocardiopsis]|uniref:MarR family winged helix-turn-helix transcriptional regulator n=1 Tax=unclassified Nocardiopsis TaxID=2649073 RepID=UPI001359073A|nr:MULTISPECIES: MarR family transcriptional regulator [unclassified Nocardiopsis]
MNSAASTHRVPRIQEPTDLETGWRRLRLFEARVRERLEAALEPHGLTCSEYAALAALHYSDDGGHLRQQFLAEAIPINQSSLSRLVGRLERSGLTERYHCAEDRRGVYTQITDKGRATVEEARKSFVAALRSSLAEQREDGLRDAITTLLPD